MDIRLGFDSLIELFEHAFLSDFFKGKFGSSFYFSFATFAAKGPKGSRSFYFVANNNITKLSIKKRLQLEAVQNWRHHLRMK